MEGVIVRVSDTIKLLLHKELREGAVWSEQGIEGYVNCSGKPVGLSIVESIFGAR